MWLHTADLFNRCPLPATLCWVTVLKSVSPTAGGPGAHIQLNWFDCGYSFIASCRGCGLAVHLLLQERMFPAYARARWRAFAVQSLSKGALWNSLSSEAARTCCVSALSHDAFDCDFKNVRTKLLKLATNRLPASLQRAHSDLSEEPHQQGWSPVREY